MAFSLWGSTQFGGKVDYFYLERQQDMSIDDLVFFLQFGAQFSGRCRYGEVAIVDR